MMFQCKTDTVDCLGVAEYQIETILHHTTQLR